MRREADQGLEGTLARLRAASRITFKAPRPVPMPVELVMESAVVGGGVHRRVRPPTSVH